MGVLVQGSNLLAIVLYKAMLTNWKNIFFSPFSILSVLSMLMYGAREETESELQKFLAYESIDRDVLANTFQTFISSLNRFSDGYTISYANSLVVDKQFDIVEQYKLDLRKFFKAHCVQEDFLEEPQAALDQINDWVTKKTDGMISKVLESLDPGTVMILLNAVYFKGFWLEQFPEAYTFRHYFYNQGKERNAKLVDMMHIKKSFQWLETESFTALQLPYKGKEIAMLIILPNYRDSLQEVEGLITANFISETKKYLRGRKIQVALPKFRLEFSADLKGMLEELGVKQIFRDGANFDGISHSQDLAVSRVIHKAVIEVNENGTEASAATISKMRLRSIDYSPEFVVDHPFIFVIYNLKSDLILFMGRVVEL